MVSNPYLQVFVGGVTVVLLWKITGTDTYLGLGGGTIAQSFAEPAEIVGISVENIIYMYHTLFWF